MKFDSVFASLFASLWLALPAVAQERASVGGKVPDTTFQFLNGDGRTSLSDFFGQPVMIEIWGTH